MNKLPVELITNILDYEGRSIRWRNGKFINKYKGDISHMYTINFKHLYINNNNNNTIIQLSHKIDPINLFNKSLICSYLFDNNGISFIIGNFKKVEKYNYNPNINQWTQ